MHTFRFWFAFNLMEPVRKASQPRKFLTQFKWTKILYHAWLFISNFSFEICSNGPQWYNNVKVVTLHKVFNTHIHKEFSWCYSYLQAIAKPSLMLDIQLSPRILQCLLSAVRLSWIFNRTMTTEFTGSVRRIRIDAWHCRISRYCSY